MVARVFEVAMVAEGEVVQQVADKHCHAGADSNVSKKKLTHSRDYLDREPAVPGEQVAARVKGNEDGPWILGNVLQYDPVSQSYMVQDEDDVSRIINLAYEDVKRLEDSFTNLRRGDQVLAVFPETTSFYRAVVVKNTTKPSAAAAGTTAGTSSGSNSSSSSNTTSTTMNSNSSNNNDVVVKFEDDEDENGRNPARRVPARFVLRRSDVDDGDDSAEED